MCINPKLMDLLNELSIQKLYYVMINKSLLTRLNEKLIILRNEQIKKSKSRDIFIDSLEEYIKSLEYANMVEDEVNFFMDNYRF